MLKPSYLTRSTRGSPSHSGASDSKSIAQFLLGESAFEIAAAAFACATKSEETQLAQRFDYSRSSITKGTGLAVIARCQVILAGANELQSSLGKYGITAAKLATLKKRIEVYKKALTKPREQQANSSAATKALPKLLAKADAILDQQLDKLVVQFKESDAEFVDKYSSARIIVDIGGTARNETPASSTPKTTEPGSSTTPAK